MSLPLDAVGPAVDREWQRFHRLLLSADEASWTAPTRLAGWTVRDLAAHAVWGASMEADALRRRRTGTSGRAEGHAVGDAVRPGDVLDRLDAARRELKAEIDELAEEDLPSTAPLPYGDVPVAVFTQILVMEAGVHTSDLAAAVGQADALAPDVVVATDVFVRLFLPVVAASAAESPGPGTTIALRGPGVDLGFRYADGAWEAEPPGSTGGGAAPAATVTGDDSSILLFALGRIPVTDTRLSVSGDATVAGAFKDWMPGP